MVYLFIRVLKRVNNSYFDQYTRLFVCYRIKIPQNIIIDSSININHLNFPFLNQLLLSMGSFFSDKNIVAHTDI